MATFPRFRAIEKKHGSLIRGMLAARRSLPPATQTNGSRPRTTFMSLRPGITRLAEALQSSLQGDLRVNVRVQSIQQREQGYHLALADGSVFRADAVILATPAYAAATMVEDLNPDLAVSLRSIRYVSTGTLSLAYRRSDIHRSLASFGLVIPRSEGRRINAITLTSSKWPDRAPEDQFLMRVFFGGSRHPDVFALPDEELLALVKQEVNAILGIDKEPVLSRIYRWRNASPQYDIGHLERVSDMESTCPTGIYLTGSAYRGVGIPDCVAQGEATARQLLDDLQALPKTHSANTVRMNPGGLPVDD